ncbi:unnamed protein product, partial [Pylaiella littoralis]
AKGLKQKHLAGRSSVNILAAVAEVAENKGNGNNVDRENVSHKFCEIGHTGEDRIHVLSETITQQPDSHDCLVFPPSPLVLKPGEGAEYLSPFTRVVGGDVTLDRQRHTTA